MAEDDRRWKLPKQAQPRDTGAEGSEDRPRRPEADADSSDQDPSRPGRGEPSGHRHQRAPYSTGSAPYSRHQPSRGGSTASRSGRGNRPAHRASERDFFRIIVFTIVGAIIPGVGLIAGRRRVVGGIVLAGFAALTIGGIAWATSHRSSLLVAAVNPHRLKLITIGMIVLGVIWVLVIIASYLSLARRPLRRGQRLGASILVAVLSFVIAAPVAVGARYSYDQAGLVSTVFHQQKHSESATRPSSEPTAKTDPWKDKPRVNILLLGGDAGPDRTGTRTDTVMVASIDTRTGDTTLISLPRNTARMPFPADSPLHKYYPNGFTNGDGNNAEYFLNAMYDNVPAQVPANILGKTDNLGADVLKLSVGEATGLKIDYYVLIDLAGFKRLIDALGGITVNINTYVAIGGNTDLHIPPKSWLKPGPNQHLNGVRALWFARGRYGADDFQRMDRQRCVVNAIIEQANPTNVLTRYEAIAKAGKEIVKTDIPQEALPAFVDLSLRAKHGNVRSLVFKHGVNGFSSPDPNFSLVRDRVAKALAESSSPPKKAGKPKPTTPGAPTSSPPATTSASAQSESAADACAWNPSVAATSQPPG